MTTETTDDVETEEQIDPRLENAFGSKFEDSPMDPSDVGEVLADIYTDESFQHVLEYHAKDYLQDNYTLDRETIDILKELIAKDGISSVFPYRNALVRAETVDIQCGDHVFKEQQAWDYEDREYVIKEYEVCQIQDHGTQLALEEVAHYDHNRETIIDEVSSVSYCHPNTAQVAHDDAWELERSPREDDQ